MEHAHDLILLGGLLCLASIFAGFVSARVNAPLLLVFLAIGMLAGEDGPGALQFSDFNAAYLVGSIALAFILFDGGLQTERSMLRIALWPALGLATVGVAITAGIVATAGVFLLGAPWGLALVMGAVLAPTDAAAVGLLLRQARVALPDRLFALLEIESGLNDPMSVFLTVMMVEWLASPTGLSTRHALLMLGLEMGGGAVAGIAGGYLLLLLLRRLTVEAPLFPILALAGVLCVFGGAQRVGASGFLAVYLMGVITGTADFATKRRMEQFYEALAWLAQISLFLMLGMLVTPHRLWPALPAILAVAVVLVFVARPVATVACLLPFGFDRRATAFAAWTGLRGAVPIYLTIIPVLAGTPGAVGLFGVAFGTVVLSVLVQGWTIRPVAALLGYRRLEG